MKNIKYNDIDLPEWLFYRDESRAAGASPTDSLNISASMNGGNAWTSSTSPSAGHKPKVVVLTKASLIKELNKSDLLGMASWFRANGFKVYIACEGDQEEGVFKEVDDNIDFRLFDKLRYIDQDTDNEKLATLGVARDKLVIVESEKMTGLNGQLNLYQTLDAENYHAISRGYKLALHRDFDHLPVKKSWDEEGVSMHYLFKYNPQKAIEYIKNKQVGEFRNEWIRDCDDPNALVELSKLRDEYGRP